MLPPGITHIVVTSALYQRIVSVLCVWADYIEAGAIVRSEQPRQTDRQLLEAGHRRLVSSVLTQEVRRQHVIIRRGQTHLWPRDSCEGGYRCGEEQGQRDQYLRRKSPEPGMTVWPCVGAAPATDI